MGKQINAKTLINNFLQENDWRVKENSSSLKSFGGLNKYIVAEVSKNYWLNEVYPPRIKKAYLSGEQHIHDLGGLTLYCCGFSLENILLMGVQGVENIPTSSPATHFDSALNQIANLITVYQNEIMGAVALNSFDTLLAPFIQYDNLTEREVKQSLQNFIYSINSNSRGGAEPAFSNVTLDVTPTSSMMKKNIIIGGKYDAILTYGDFQKEMDVFNKVFSELMIKGDAKGEPFAYPILTYNIGTRFDWDNPKNEPIFEMAGKFGYPYFANFGRNSEMGEDDARSMCCRLRLDLTELRRRNGGLFGSGDNTGSVGVVTINMPRLGYLAKDKKQFFRMLNKQLKLSKDSLELKREFLQKSILEGGLLPAYMTYVGTLDNHFSTIGVVGLNEMCVNFMGKGITTKEGKEFALEVGEHIRKKLQQFQEETGNLYNYEATPAESTCYRLARKDKELYPDIYAQGTQDVPYYTNSCHIPVSEIGTIKEVYDNQDDLQVQFTGGTVIHNYMNGGISADKAKKIIRTIMEEYKAPYTSLSPVTRYCPEHGYIEAEVDECPLCGSPVDYRQRITGYTRKVKNFNAGKAQEFIDRKQHKTSSNGIEVE